MWFEFKPSYLAAKIRRQTGRCPLHKGLRVYRRLMSSLPGRYSIPESSRTNADDRLSLDPFGPVEGGDAIVEGSHFADVCQQPTSPGPLDDLTQLGAIGY